MSAIPVQKSVSIKDLCELSPAYVRAIAPYQPGKPASELAHWVSHTPHLDSAAEKLVALANERDGSDNVSVVLIRVLSVERMGMYRGRPYKLR